MPLVSMRYSNICSLTEAQFNHPELWQSKLPSLCLATLQLLIHIPQYCSRQYCTQGEGLQQQHFIYSFVQQKLLFSTTVVAQGAFRTQLEKLTSWYSQKQLAGRKATPDTLQGNFSLGYHWLVRWDPERHKANSFAAGFTLAAKPKQHTLPQEGMAVTSRPGCYQDELFPTRHLNTGKCRPAHEKPGQGNVRAVSLRVPPQRRPPALVLGEGR